MGHTDTKHWRFGGKERSIFSFSHTIIFISCTYPLYTILPSLFLNIHCVLWRLRLFPPLLLSAKFHPTDLFEDYPYLTFSPALSSAPSYSETHSLFAICLVPKSHPRNWPVAVWVEHPRGLSLRLRRAKPKRTSLNWRREFRLMRTTPRSQKCGRLSFRGSAFPRLLCSQDGNLAHSHSSIVAR